MNPLASILLSIRALGRNKVRTFLTMLGIVIGIASVIAMVAIGQGASKRIESQINSMGRNLMMVLPGALSSGGFSMGSGSVTTLTPEDGLAIQKEVPSVESMTPVVRARGLQLVYGSLNWAPNQIMGCSPAFVEVRDWTTEEGAFFTDGDVVSAFQPAGDRRTAAAFRCRNGQSYGIGLLARFPSLDHGYSIHAGIYPTQDTSDPEERAWLCLDTSDLVACTTHLANTKATVALAQCRYLFDTAIPALPRRGRAEPTVLGADLNLKPHHLPDVRSCLPSGYVQTYDGGTQYIVGSRDLRVSSGTTIGMSKTTDHPGLLGTLSTTAG